MPKVIILNLKDEIKIEEIYLTNALSVKRFLIDPEWRLCPLEKKTFRVHQSVYSTGKYDTLDINHILEQISKHQNLKDEVILEAIKRIGKAKSFWQTRKA